MFFRSIFYFCSLVSVLCFLCSWNFWIKKSKIALITSFILLLQYFSPGAGSNVPKTYFYFLKLTKKYFILPSEIKNAQYKIKNTSSNTQNTVKLNLQRSKLFYIHFQTKDIKTIFTNNFSSKIDTFANT